MLDIAICDDDNYFSGELEALLCSMGQAYGLEFEIDIYRDGSSLVEAIQKGKYYDIICLDIQMREMDGLEAARQIRRVDRIVELIYVTSYDSYMKAVFEVSPSGFIVKPIQREEFEQIFGRVLQTVMGQDEYYRFRYDKVAYKVPLRDILYFMSDLRKTQIKRIGGSYIEYRKLNDISKSLEQGKGQFLRIHKSYLVNYRHIVKFSYNQVEVSNGDVLPISEQRKRKVNEHMVKLMAILPR